MVGLLGSRFFPEPGAWPTGSYIQVCMFAIRVCRGEGDGEPLAEPIFSVQIWMFLTRKKLRNSWSFYWDHCRNLKKCFISIQKFLSLHPLGVWSFFCDETCMFLKPSSFWELTMWAPRWDFWIATRSYRVSPRRGVNSTWQLASSICPVF